MSPPDDRHRMTENEQNAENGGTMESILKEYVEHHLREQGDDVELALDDDLVLIGFDSIGYVRLLDFINSEFGVHVPDADVTVEQFGTVASIAAYLRDRSGSAVGAAE